MRNCPYHSDKSRCLFLWISPLYKYCRIYKELEIKKGFEFLGYEKNCGGLSSLSSEGRRRDFSPEELLRKDKDGENKG
jgi:hypothetical protein